MSTQTISDFAGSDIIDVRDIIARVETLREEREDLFDVLIIAEEERQGRQNDEEYIQRYEEAEKAMKEWLEENNQEQTTLEDLLSDLCGYGGDEQWEGNWYPVTLIKDSYFEESMDEMLEDCGELPKSLPPYLTITVDYDALKQDYSEVEFEGDTYYYR